MTRFTSTSGAALFDAKVRSMSASIGAAVDARALRGGVALRDGVELVPFAFRLLGAQVYGTTTRATIQIRVEVLDRVTGVPIELTFTRHAAEGRPFAESLRMALVWAMTHEVNESIFLDGRLAFQGDVARDHGGDP